MESKKPQLIGVGLFVVSLIIAGLAQVFFKPQEIVRSVPSNVSVTVGPAPRIGQFGDILIREDKRLAQSTKKATQVLGTQSTITPTIAINKLDKYDLSSTQSGKITVSVVGDSMIDTLQRELPQLKTLLAQAYPNIEFKLYNHGVGASDIESGLLRLTNSYTYLDTNYPSVISQNPDIIVIESFAYNPWSNSKGDLDRQWLTIAKMIDTIKAQLPNTKIVLAATLAPNSKTFGDGSINFDDGAKQAKVQTIRSYLQNMVNFASSQNLPLADAYHASLNEQGEGDRKFIDAQGNIHPSGPGGYLFSQKVVDAIIENNLIVKD